MNNYDSLIDTLDHIEKVKEFGSRMSNDLTVRLITHDISKTKEFEKPIFDEFTPKLKDCTYGSDEYKSFLSEMGVALNHHYENNRHHPEYFKNGMDDMNLIDLCEMIVDWKAATLRHKDSDIMKSIEMNQSRFGYSDDIKRLLINTVKDYFEM